MNGGQNNGIWALGHQSCLGRDSDIKIIRFLIGLQGVVRIVEYGPMAGKTVQEQIETLNILDFY